MTDELKFFFRRAYMYKTFCGLNMIFIICIVCLAPLNAGAEPENFVKAAILFNLTKFVEWPPDAFGTPDAPVILSILGKDPFGEDALRTIENKYVGKRRLLIQKHSGIKEIKLCHSVFVSSSEEENLPEIISHFKNKPVLIVGGTKGFARRGGMIGLIKVENKIRFEINNEAAKRCGVKISSRLLKLARIIKSEPMVEKK